MKITARGRVTIPQHILDELDLKPGAEVEWELIGDAALLRKATSAPHVRGHELVRRMRGRGTAKITTDEVMTLMRGPHP